MKRYLSIVGCTFSILLNAILGGEYNQTFSARNWELKRNNRFNLVILIDFLHKEQDHCLMSYVRWLYIKRGLQEINDLHSKLKNRKFDTISW